MKKSQLIQLLKDVPDDCEIQVEFPCSDAGPGESTSTMPVHSVTIEHTAENEIWVVIRL